VGEERKAACPVSLHHLLEYDSGEVSLCPSPTLHLDICCGRRALGHRDQTGTSGLVFLKTTTPLPWTQRPKQVAKATQLPFQHLKVEL